MHHELSREDRVVSTRTLRSGMSRGALERALRSGAIRRVRRGWYALAGAHPDVVNAVQAGGRLSCVSRLRACGVWTVDDRRVHVRVAKGATVGGIRPSEPTGRRSRWIRTARWTTPRTRSAPPCRASTSQQVMSNMPEITTQVLAVVRRGEHRWRVVHGRRGA